MWIFAQSDESQAPRPDTADTVSSDGADRPSPESSHRRTATTGREFLSAVPGRRADTACRAVSHGGEATVMTTECDPYRVLGLLPSASRAEVTSAYRRLLRAHHPDTRTTGRDTAEQCDDETLRQILAAYELLRDPSAERPMTEPSLGPTQGRVSDHRGNTPRRTETHPRSERTLPTPIPRRRGVSARSSCGWVLCAAIADGPALRPVIRASRCAALMPF